jgi:hypothetical protein
MQTRPSPDANGTLYHRIDALQMSTAERELAKARLQAAERFADGVCEVTAAMGACAAFVARHVRTLFTVSPQH